MRGIIVLLSGLVMLLIAGCGPLAAPVTGGDAHAGAQIYTKYGCLSCHAINGQSATGPIIAHDLTNDLSEANYNLLRYYLLDDPPKGMEYTRNLGLTSKNIADLNAMDNSSLPPVKVAAPPPAPAATPTVTPATTGGNTPPPAATATSAPPANAAGDPAAGAHLWVTTQCVRCHVINGVGGSVAEDLTNKPSMKYDAWLALAHNPQQPAGMQYVPGLNLTDTQIRDMSAFAFSSLTPK